MAVATIGILKRSPEPGLVIILCADPDLSVRIAHWLGQASFRTVQAADGYRASHLLDQEATIAIVTDRVLPPWPGLDAFPLLRKSRPGLAVVYVGTGDVDDDGLARAAGASHVLPCPLRRQSVLNALPRAVAAA